MNQEQPIIVGLDIGTTKIAAIAGRKNEFGKLEILGFGRANSNGVQHGMVLNIDQTIKAIQTALENCYASNPNLEIEEVYVGIAGHHIKSLQTRGDIVRQCTDDEITQKEIDQLVAEKIGQDTVFPSLELATEDFTGYIVPMYNFVLATSGAEGVRGSGASSAIIVCPVEVPPGGYFIAMMSPAFTTSPTFTSINDWWA